MNNIYLLRRKCAGTVLAQICILGSPQQGHPTRAGKFSSKWIARLQDRAIRRRGNKRSRAEGRENSRCGFWFIYL